jgi:hypothetical protein
MPLSLLLEKTKHCYDGNEKSLEKQQHLGMPLMKLNVLVAHRNAQLMV